MEVANFLKIQATFKNNNFLNARCMLSVCITKWSKMLSLKCIGEAEFYN